MRLFLLSNRDERAGFGSGAPMLGVRKMSAALSTGTNENKVSHDQDLDSVIALLRRALGQLDGMKAPPEFGARLQELLDLMIAHRN